VAFIKIEIVSPINVKHFQLPVIGHYNTTFGLLRLRVAEQVTGQAHRVSVISAFWWPV